MATLPSISMPTEVVDGVTVRGLSRAQHVDLARLDAGDQAELECQLIRHSFGVPLDEAKAWYDATPSKAVERIVEKIIELSGMGERGNDLSTPSLGS